MQKNKQQLLDKANDYLNNILGITFKAKEDDSMSSLLPYYLKASFDFSSCMIDDFNRLLVIPKESTNGSILSKRVADIYFRTSVKPVLLLDNIDSVRRKFFISDRIDFIVPGKQVYLPSLAVVLSERGLKSANNAEVASLSPSAQVLLLYHLQKRSLNGQIISEIAKYFPYSVKTVSSAVKELVYANICETEGDNSGKMLHFPSKAIIWKTAYPLLSNPIKEVLYSNSVEKIPIQSRYITYDKALSQYTFIAGSSVNAFAVYKNDDFIKKLKNDNTLNKVEGQYRIELWKYNPAILAKRDTVDELSLALCYKDCDDERVLAEIGEMTDRICKD